MAFLQNNPFLVDLEEEQQQPAPRHQQRCKLPDFWPSNPVLWFARAEFNFEVSGVVTEREKFMHAANALSYDALTLVADLVTQPPAIQPYQRLKERLLISHQLTSVQMAERIFDMPELGDRRPSQLLAAMMEFCPEGEVNSAFFRASFLCRLPREIRVLLADEVRGDLKDMAVRADKLFQHHRPKVAATMDMAVDEDLAVRANKAGFRGKKKEAPAAVVLATAVVVLAVAAPAVASLTSSVTATGSMAPKLSGVTPLTSVSGRRKTRQPGGGVSPRAARRQWPFSSPRG